MLHLLLCHSEDLQIQMILSICISQEKSVNLLSQTLSQKMQYFSPQSLHFISADAAAVNSMSHIDKWNVCFRAWE